MVTPCYYPVKGGTETTVRNLATALNKNGVKTDVMAFNVNQTRKPKWQGKTDIIDGTTFYRIPTLNWMSSLHSVRITAGVNFIPGRFTHILRRYDIIHFHELEFSFPFFSFFMKKPKILHLHGIDYNFLKKHHISRFLLKHLAHTYISISKQMKKELTSLGIPKHKIIYLPNSIDTDLFKPNKRKEENLLLFVGRISAGKGLHVLLEALHYLKNPVHLTIIGPPDPTEVVKWYQKASIFILPSFVEGFPVTVLEALACETPVIATPVGGIPEAIQNDKNGILIPQNNPVKLAEAIQLLLGNKDLRKQFG